MHEQHTEADVNRSVLAESDRGQQMDLPLHSAEALCCHMYSSTHDLDSDIEFLEELQIVRSKVDQQLLANDFERRHC